MKPLVSLILTTYNCKENFQKTYQSIQSQDYDNIEIIIKDGGSTDGTMETIVAYQRQSKYTVKWNSGPDQGIFDAMNVGISMASGDIIAICNEHYLCSNAVRIMVEAIQNNPGCVGAHCDLNYMLGEKVVRKWRMGDGCIEQGWLPGHPSLYLRHEIYEKYGKYDTSFRIGADYEFMIRFLKERTNKLVYVPQVLIGMYYGGTSTSGLLSYWESFKEGHRALAKNGIKHAWLIDIRRTLRVLGQFHDVYGGKR